jgi:hypothetical protein
MLARAWFIAFALCVICALSSHVQCQGLTCCPAPQACVPTVPVCPQPIVPIGPCCLPSSFFPPEPPVVAPLIIGCPVPMYRPCGPPPPFGSMPQASSRVRKTARSAYPDQSRFRLQGSVQPPPR